jgi:hypothetical protein
MRYPTNYQVQHLLIEIQKLDDYAVKAHNRVNCIQHQIDDEMTRPCTKIDLEGHLAYWLDEHDIAIDEKNRLYDQINLLSNGTIKN